MPHGAGHARTRSAAMPCVFLSKLPGHLAICVYVYDYNNNIIMCIGLVHGIFVGNI